MRGFSLGVLCVAILGMGACTSSRRVSFPDHLRDYVTEPFNPGFGVYQEVAREVEQKCGDLVWRVNFTPGQKESAMERCAPFWGRLRAAQREKIAFVYVPYSPFSPPVERRAWRFLGRVLIWQMEKFLREKKTEEALSLFVLGVRFGADLSGGDAMDADLGYTIMEDCLRVLWPRFPNLTPAQLRSLHQTVQEVLLGMPSLETILRHEQAGMLQCVEMVQEWYLQGRTGELGKFLGEDALPAIRYLERLRSSPISEQVKYFEGFASEARQEIDYWIQEVSKPPHLWADPPPPVGERPWRRFAKHFFGGARFLRHRWIINQAWLRLFGVDSAIYARVVERSSLPADLSEFPLSLRTDPFSGQDFLYYPLRGSYRLYSVGENRLDDGGVIAGEASEQDLLPKRGR
ncbi:MAG: hypothetical protein K6T17_00750 [Fimbriimonadales bacterium]|nr:hypothetical protein [Fimbriimonadales bacterium]